MIISYCLFLQLGGSPWTVQLGRRDSTTASYSAANSDLPSPTLDLNDLLSTFKSKGFTEKETVALAGKTLWNKHFTRIFSNRRGGYTPLEVVVILESNNRVHVLSFMKLEAVLILTSFSEFSLSGAHTIGQARCLAFRDRIYNEKNINTTFAASLQSNCPTTGGDENLSPLDATSPVTFDNAYFKNLVNSKGLLHSDQQLFSGGSTDSQVTAYITNPVTFRTDFANAMAKMGSLSPLTGNSGQIRTDCRKVNIWTLTTHQPISNVCLVLIDAVAQIKWLGQNILPQSCYCNL